MIKSISMGEFSSLLEERKERKNSAIPKILSVIHPPLIPEDFYRESTSLVMPEIFYQASNAFKTVDPYRTIQGDEFGDDRDIQGRLKTT